MSAPPSNPAEYFNALAAAYAAHRPGYPDAAIDWILDGLGGEVRAVDVGCGTGISTRTLAARGVRIIGIDPSEPMLDSARKASAGLATAPEYRRGTGDRTGLPDGSVDLVLCAQSFHWLAPPRALPEFHRVLRAGGRMALMWNRRDGDASAFDAILEDITNRSQDDAAARGLTVVRHREFSFESFGRLFSDVEQRTFDNAQRLTFDQLLGRFRSASYFPPEGSAFRAQLECELREAFEKYQHHDTVTMAQMTNVTRATRAD